MNSQFQLNLVVAATVAPDFEARSAWNELMSNLKFDELDPRVFNLLPGLYTKIGKMDGVLEANRLRGVYIYNASINLRREAQLRNLIRLLDKNEIDYRVLKGMAISLLSGNIGIRSMGDVDLLIHRRDFSKFMGVSKEAQLRLLFDFECERKRDQKIDNKINFISQGNLEIDLHFSDTSFPNRILESMMNKKAHLVVRNGQQYKLPEPKLLVEHVSVHGIQQVGAVDKYRAYLDLSLLESISARSENESAPLLARKYINSISTKNHIQHQIKFTQYARKIFFLEKCRQVRRIRAKLRFRGTDLPSTYVSIKRHPSILYFIWIVSGRLQLVERTFSKFFQGFLKVPSEILPNSKNIPVGMNLKLEKSILNSFVSPFEVRIKVKTMHEAPKHDIYFYCDEFKTQDYEIFCNGQMLGKNIANDLGTLGVSVFTATKSLEISIRNPIHSCLKCQGDFKSLTVRLENGMEFLN
jgi:hypothetical protein